MPYQLFKFHKLKEARKLVYNIDKISSIYQDNNKQMYIIIKSNENSNTLNKVEELIYKWGRAEIEQSLEFIQLEQQSKYNKLGRVLIINNISIMRTFLPLTEIMTIINYTENSFSDGKKYNNINSIISDIKGHLESGASIIDIGVNSTSYGNIQLSVTEEKEKLSQLILDVINLKKTYNFQISIDSFNEDNIKWILDYDVDIINDVSGKISKDLVKAITDNNKQYVLMHSMTLPANKDIHINVNIDPTKYVHNFFLNELEILDKLNIKFENIILDPGIGFGKIAVQSWQLLNNLPLWKSLPCEILIGHSRKSFLTHINDLAPNNRDVITAYISAVCMKNKIDYLRVHNTKMTVEILTNCNQIK